MDYLEYYGYYDKLWLRFNFLAYDDAKTDNQRKEALKVFSDRLFLDDVESFSKPTNMKQVHVDHDDKKDTDDEEDDQELKSFSSYFNQNEVFNKRVMINQLIEEGMPTAIHPVRSLIAH